ncbi:aminopeptidase P family N-terminal domain-containing protein [Pseudonocardia adelaidensis]|uniref:Xaa-Pro aminopeptidase n=1 Tax=Pseudonocardia adelaidensis TaxID=648754 RepID=A0ABP9NDP8_9PSEU
MKRGLVVLDPAEVSEAERTGRVLRLQRRLAAEGVTIALDYADVHRSDDLAYLTNLCLYWNEGILAVPVVGEPTFLMKLSPRVHPWMRRSSTLTDLRSGKGFTALVEGLLGGLEPGVLGLVDAALCPATAVEEVRAAAPGWEIRPLGGLVREQRLVPSAAERALLRDAQAHLEAGLDAVSATGGSDGERIALVEQALRGAGFTDVFAEVVHGPDGVAAVDVTGQYRFCWVRAARLVGPNPPWARELDRALAAAVAAVAPGVAASAPVTAAEEVLAGLPAGAVASATVVHQADLSTGGDYADPAEPVPAGAVVVVGVEVLFPDGGRVAVTETVPVEAS